MKRIQYQKAKIEWNKKAWLHTNFILHFNDTNIRLGRIYFHSTLLIRCFVLTAKSWGTLEIRWPTICSLCRQDNVVSLLSLASTLP